MRWNYTLSGKKKLDADRPTEPTSYQLAILQALSKKSNQQVYQGTASLNKTYARRQRTIAAKRTKKARGNR